MSHNHGNGSNGDQGSFRLGAAGKYRSGCNSGGGSGGYGDQNDCSSGGGGYGWTFNESSFNSWKSGDESNSFIFELDSSFYLSECQIAGGDTEFARPDGQGREQGHSGNGNAKITPE